MNSSRYIVARFFLSFGLYRKKKRLGEVVDESHLLFQAEEILGEEVWEQVEDVEAISTDYWNLRKIKMELSELKDMVEDADALLNSSHEERQIVLSQTNEECQALEAKRNSYISEVEELILQRDRTIAEAKILKRKFEGAKTKIQVIRMESGKESDIADARKSMEAIKLEFTKLKNDRDSVGRKIDKLNEKVTHVEEALGVDRKRLRDEASIAYQSIGKANRDVSKLSSEIVMCENSMLEHYRAIGSFVSQHVGVDPICTEVAKANAHLVIQMQSLRSSIALNQKLLGMID